ncbi:MAG: hypothetical protein K8F52_06920 [Candidatus Scalindua rubra]|uniref:Uncharacterized protein n=1 Tax=Candidatus Scalindua brodae TaxID=237368 RepID=A0A0B0EL62_9BACT|nr:MAG: hypothetical protein SCABRO_02862 [Candidatus Scalindua brodae]MBZ0108384.1 hypothetical protein [Candidatus Scalindua rubra]TWU34081.1 hypothetical protein S225a_13390 [Candidatus Brocadiaceae bacterium S225]
MSAAPVKPVIKSFLIADTVIQEQISNKWSAIGIFDRLYSTRFPLKHHSLSLYICLADAEGDYNIRVEFCDAESRKLALFEGITLNVPSRLQSVDFGIRTRDLPIPKAGKYSFDLYFNDQSAGSVQLSVEKVELK